MSRVRVCNSFRLSLSLPLSFPPPLETHPLQLVGGLNLVCSMPFSSQRRLLRCAGARRALRTVCADRAGGSSGGGGTDDPRPLCRQCRCIESPLGQPAFKNAEHGSSSDDGSVPSYGSFTRQ